MGGVNEPARPDASPQRGCEAIRAGGAVGGTPRRRQPLATPDPPLGSRASRSAFGQAPVLPLTAVPECENDAKGRFTLRPSGDSHSGRQSSAVPPESFRVPWTGATRSVLPQVPLGMPNASPKHANRSAECDLRPAWSARTTQGFDTHFVAPTMCTGVPGHPQVQQRLAARLLGSACHTSGSGRGGSDPRRGLGTGSGRGGNPHLAPRPPWVASAATIPPGRGFSTAMKAADQPLAGLSPPVTLSASPGKPDAPIPLAAS